MNQLKKNRLKQWITCLIFVIALLFIDTLTATPSDQLSSLKGDQSSRSEEVRETPKKPQKNISADKFLPEVSSQPITNLQEATLYARTDKEQQGVSRGLASRNTGIEARTKIKKAEDVSPAKTESNETMPVISSGISAQTALSANLPADSAQTAPSTASESENPAGKEADLLARLITAEAQGEPYQAKVAVGAVVINRVQSGLWANSIREVIYQNINGSYQFTPVVNGWIDRPAEPESIQAAKEAIAGADPTKGAQFYYDDSATNAWILSKTVAVQIGHMIYAY
ncbi:cell wall hydrolase [Aminipila luticellarii]